MKLITVAASLSLGSLMFACGGGGGGADSDSNADETPEGSDVDVFPTRVFSGFDGANTYKVPVVVNDPSGRVTWSISDPSIATLTPSGTNDGTLMITTKRAGEARIKATVGGVSAEVPLRVYAYTQQQYAAGKQRYENSADADNPACSTCHGGGPNHSPSEIGRDPDDDIVTMIVTGIDPESNPSEPARIADRTEFAGILRGKTHEWKVTETEKKGLVAYIRALPPIGRPALDDDD